MSVYLNKQQEVTDDTYKEDLAFSIDGIDSSNNDITLSGSTDQRGHVRILRGLTLLKGNSSAINYD